MIRAKFEAEVHRRTSGRLLKLETPQKASIQNFSRQDSTKDKTDQGSYRKFRKSIWTKQEDELLKQKVQERGPIQWAQIASFLPNRSGKQCRERWHNHLREGVTKASWEINEYWILALCVRAFGRKWSAISEFIPGRSDNTIKNQWNCKMKPLKAYFENKIDKLLKVPETWTTLSSDQQVLLQMISKTNATLEDKELLQFYQKYCAIFKEGLEEYEELKRELSTEAESQLQSQSCSDPEMVNDLSAAISAGNCIFYESEQENPIMPKSLFR